MTKEEKEEKELLRFVSDPKFREKALLKVKKEEDRKYQKNVRKAQKEKERLIKAREEEIIRIENSRWEVYAKGQLKINKVEGSVIVNTEKVLFSNIKGAELNIQDGFRTITTETMTTKRKPSIGSAVAGGLIGGKYGAVLGGAALNKSSTTNTSNTDAVPTCLHMGVIIDIDGFKQEVILINSQIDQSSKEYLSAYNEAQSIIMKLREVTRTPVPESFIPSQEEQSVKDIEKQIDEASERLNAAVNDKPKYKIPVKYRTKEHSNMSDEEYLNYLSEEDKKRGNLPEVNNKFTTDSSILSIVSLILGIMALAFTDIVGVVIILSAIGLIAGIVVLVKKKPKKGLAIAGVVISVLAIIAILPE